MKKILFLLFGFFFLNTTFCQNAEELNNEARILLSQRDYEKAFPLVKKAAQLGNAEAQYNLGYFLQNGVGTTKNEIEAFRWYKKSSEGGFNDAHYAMMMAYGNGIGTEKNDKKAFEYALKCANNNDATCMWNMVNCYKQGLGVAKDLTKMLDWANKLALLENPENLSLSGNITSTRLSLAYMYRDGDSVTQDFYKSYLWFLIYNEFKRDFSVNQQSQIFKEIKTAESKLSEDQLKSAKEDAEKIFGRRLINFDNLYKTDR